MHLVDHLHELADDELSYYVNQDRYKDLDPLTPAVVHSSISLSRNASILLT